MPGFAERRAKSAAKFRITEKGILSQKRAKAKERERYHTDPVFKEKILSRDRKARRLKYHSDPAFRARQRDRKPNKAQRRVYQRNWTKLKRKTDELFRLKGRLRTRIKGEIKKFKLSARTQEILGADWQTVKTFIEAQFQDGMSWNNMAEWHIDHIIPLAQATDAKMLFALMHYKNLQPLWKKDNLRKADRIGYFPYGSTAGRLF